MRTRTRTDSTAGDRLDLSWNYDNDQANSTDSEEKDNLETQGNPPEDTGINTPDINDQSSTETVYTLPNDEPQDDIPETEVSQQSDEEAGTDTAEQPVAEQESTPDLETQQEEPQSSEEQSAAIGKKTQTKVSRQKKNTTFSIVEADGTLGEKLRALRENANINVEDIAQRLVIRNSVINDLEEGNYDSLCETYGDNNIYIVSTLKDICRELGASSTRTDELIEMLYREMHESNHSFNDTLDNQIDDKHEGSGGFQVNSDEPIIQKITKLLIIAVIIGFVIFLFISVVMPYIKRNQGTQQEQRIEFAPLMETERHVPSQLPVP